MPEREEFKMPPEWGWPIGPDVITTKLSSCDTCGRDLDDWGALLIGYSHSTRKTETRPDGDSDGTFIIQCPCSKRYCFHANRYNIQTARDLCRSLPNEWKWPCDADGQSL